MAEQKYIVKAHKSMLKYKKNRNYDKPKKDEVLIEDSDGNMRWGNPFAKDNNFLFTKEELAQKVNYIKVDRLHTVIRLWDNDKEENYFFVSLYRLEE